MSSVAPTGDAGATGVPSAAPSAEPPAPNAAVTPPVAPSPEVDPEATPSPFPLPSSRPTPAASAGSVVEPAAVPTATPADEPEEGSACFPASATVELADGSLAAVGGGSLTVGTTVRTSASTTSDVFAWSHATPGGLYPFVAITTEAALPSSPFNLTSMVASVRGAPLLVSPGHYVYVGGRLTAADAVVVGDSLTAGDGKSLLVTGVARVTAAGLFNPHTLDGRIVIDGVLVSCYTRAVHPLLAEVLLAPLRWAYLAARWAGTMERAALRAGVRERGRSCTAARLPSVSSVSFARQTGAESCRV